MHELRRALVGVGALADGAGDDAVGSAAVAAASELLKLVGGETEKARHMLEVAAARL